jgi:hypothetical protein
MTNDGPTTDDGRPTTDDRRRKTGAERWVTPFDQSARLCREMRDRQLTCDVAVYGATPGGIYAAITAARYGRRAILVAQGQHVGGLLSSGLSIANIRYRHVHGGPFDEFAGAVLQTYVDRYGADSPVVQECRGGTWWEPHVAEAVFERLLAAQPNVQVLRNRRLLQVHRDGRRIHGFTAQDRTSGDIVDIQAAVTIDATYEGDLAAAAGVPYRVGREPRSEFWEPHAGVMLISSRENEVFPGSTGEGDRRIQAYCYRLTVTQRPDLRVPFPEPAAYNRDDYRYIETACEAGRVRRLLDVMHLGPERLRVNGKADVIANVVGGADAWPEADEAGREAIAQRHRDFTLGLFWFLQYDAVVPAGVREEARSWGLAADEFADNGHLPYELYVREARRIAGRAMATEHDFLLEPGTERSPLHDDAIGVADYVIDTHPAQHVSQPPYEEGHLNLKASQPGQVRYGSLVPVDAGGAVEGLLVPVAVSSTHVGFAVIRMEPVWMALGAAAGTAAHLALDTGTLPHVLPVETLQAALARRDHRLAFFHDVPLARRNPGLQYWATKGFFDSFYARPAEPATRSEAARWMARFLDAAGTNQGMGAPMLDPDSARPAFPDVPASHPDFDVVQRLHRLGIVDGWLDSEAFCPSAHVRRCDAARWLASLARYVGVMDAGPPPAWQEDAGNRPYLPVPRAEMCDQLFTLAFGSD